MVSAGRFRGGSFARNTAAQRALQATQPDGRSVTDLLDLYERAEWAKNQSDELNKSLVSEQITPYWLEPIGQTGLYITPNEPVDPTNCDRYPDSPWCGQSGVDAVDIATLNPASANLIFTANQDGTEYCLRLDASLFAIALPPTHICYRAPNARPFDNTPPPDPGIPEPENPQYVIPPQWFPLSFPGTGSGCVHVAQYEFYEDRNQDGVLEPYRAESTSQTGQYVVGRPFGYWVWLGKSIGGSSFTPSKAWYLLIASSTPEGIRYNEHFFDWYSELQTKPPIVTNIYPVQLFGQPECVPDPPQRFPDPPPLPLEPMSCCNTSEIEEMLRLIMLRLGTAQYPATVPKNVTDTDNETETIENLTDFLAWTFRQNDALMGQFPIDIEIKDADPAQEGNQTRKVKLPNLAESIAELYALALRGAVGGDIHTSFLMRLAAEVIATKNAALVTQDYARANASYLGYKGNTVKRKINYAFNVNKLENLEKILQESEMHIIGWQDEDKNTVQAYLEKLMFAAGIIKQVFFRPNAQAKTLVDELGNLLGLESPGELNKGETQATSEDEWRAFLQEINSATGGFNRNSPVKPEVIDPTVSGEKSVDTHFTGFDLIPGTDSDSTRS